MVSVIGPSTQARIFSALSSLHANRKILRAERMVCTPIVIAQGGTGSLVPKLSVDSSREVASISIRREDEVSPDPGSLMAIFPIRPIPKSIKSMPPKVLMRCS